MQELYDFKKTISELSEEQIINSNDFGSHQNLSDKCHFTGLSFMEKGMAGIYGDLAAHGISEKQSIKLVDDTIKELVKDKVIPEVPTEESTDGQKAMWLSLARPRVLAHLRLSGKIM